MAEISMRDIPSLQDLEQLEAELRQHIAKLKAALQHWQTCEAEYSGFMEELEGLPDDASTEDLLIMGRGFGGELADDKELRELVGGGTGPTRSREQVRERILRRVDYVLRNIMTVERQLNAAESQLETVLATGPPETEEEGLPLTEIREELDEDDNVISSSVTHPGEDTPRVVEALKKAGVHEGDLLELIPMSKKEEPELSPGVSNASDSEQPVSAPTAEPDAAAISQATANGASRKKSVSFADGTKDDPAPRADAKTNNQSLPEVARHSFKDGSRVIELNDDDEIINTAPVIPQGESSEDAALRREMLQYSMSEVGSIVAQLDLEDQGSQTSFSDDEQFDFEDIGSASSIEDEDEHGMSRNTGLDASYRAEMLALEKKLNARSFQNVGPAPGSAQSQDATTPETAKSVRFAEDIDIAPTKPSRPRTPETVQANPMSETIIERPTTTPTAPSNIKPSRFKRARTAATTAQPNDSTTQRPLFDNVTERTPSTSHPRDEFDPAVLHSQISSRYHAQRNRMIQAQGGFVRRAEDMTEADAEVDVSDDDAGGKKKVSLFKAARLRGA